MSNKNPICSIIMHDFPLRIRVGFPALSKSIEDAKINHEQGNIITEIGDPIMMNLKAYCDPFCSYQLRAPRANMTPGFMFGKMYLGDAFSAFLPILVKVPAITSSIVIDPVISAGQKNLFDMFNYVNYDVVWFLHMPSPLGVAPYLRVYAGELDSTTVTRGIIWKPSAVNTISLYCPYSNDLPVVPIGVGRLGQPGGSITIECVDDNTLETVNTPLHLLAYCCVVNVNLLGYKLTSTEGISHKELNFLPQTGSKLRSYTKYVSS